MMYAIVFTDFSSTPSIIFESNDYYKALTIFMLRYKRRYGAMLINRYTKKVFAPDWGDIDF